MNKGSIVERLCSDLIAKSRDINGLLYFTPEPPPCARTRGCSVSVLQQFWLTQLSDSSRAPGSVKSVRKE